MLSDNPNVSLKIVDCSLFTRRILVAEPNHQYLQWNLERKPAQYNYIEIIAIWILRILFSISSFKILPDKLE